MEKKHLKVFYICTKETAEAFVGKMQDSGVLAAIRAEEGCEQYDYFYPAEGEGLLLCERWQDEACLDKHRKGEPMAALNKIKDGYAMETVIERF